MHIKYNIRDSTQFQPQSNITSNSSLKTRGAAAPRTRITWASFFKFRRTFAEVIMFGEATAHEFQPNFKLSAFEIGHLVIAQYKIII